MKKRLFLIIAVLCCVLLLIATATACKDDGDTGENPGGDVTENPEPEVYYTVTFDTQGGSAMASVEVKEGAVIGNVTLPTKQCAEFVGFAEDANGEVIWDIASDKVTGNITLYAIWEDAHTWGAWETVSEPTCAAEGARKRICDKCGDDETERIPALGHDFEEEYTVDVAPDCETKGSESRHCTRCDATTDSREIEATGHTWGEWETLTAPTCIAEGTRKRICEVCGEEETDGISALGHDFTKWGYDDEYHWKICSRCGTISEKTGHVYQESGKCECGATEITPESEFTFNDLGEGTYSLAGYSGTRENIRIPATYNGGTVVSIKSSAFADCTGITSVIVPDSVTSISRGAFSGCSSLESITIPFVGAKADKTSSDTYQYPFGYIFGTSRYTGGTRVEQYYYGDSTSSTTYDYFYIPSSLRNVTVTGGNILYGAFRNCSMLTSVTIGNSVESIGESAFRDCTGLTSVTIGNSVTSIGNYAFYNCTGLTSVAIGNSVTSIGSYAFSYCTGLTSVTIPDSVTSIGIYAFRGCKGLTSVTIGNSVTSIGECAFMSCTGLTSVTIGSSVESIGGWAFNYCKGLTSVTIGNSVASIGAGAFSGCSSLESMTIPFVGAEAGKTSSDTYQYPFGYIFGTSIYTGGTGVYQHYYGDSTSSTTYDYFCIPSSLRSVTVTGGNILYGAFRNCSMLTSVTIPDSVTSIVDYAFSGCTGLTSVTIPDSVKSIGNNAFENCTGLTSVTIPDSVESIGDYAFYGCTGLTSVTIGTSVTSIGSSAFEYCYKLVEVYNKSSLNITAGDSSYGDVGYYAKNVYTEENGSRFTDTADGYRFLYDGTKGYLVGYYGEATDITLPDSFTAYDGTTVNSYEINRYAFYGCTRLTSVTIGKSVTSIGGSAFRSCTGLTSVTIGNSVTSIGSSAFYGCYKLVEVYNKSSLDITAGDSSYGDVGYYAKNVYTEENGSCFTDTADGYRFLYDGTKGYLVGYYGEATDITLPDSFTAYDGTNVNTYKIYKYAFYGNTSLTSVTIPDSVTSIGEGAFSGCSSLESITLPFVGAEAGKTSSDTYQYPLGYLFGTDSYTGGTEVTQYYYGNSTSSSTSDTYYIPSSLRSVTVTGGNILYGAFYGCSMLTSVTIPDSVTSIGDYAFRNCSGLTSVTIGSSVESIGSYAFDGCTGLTSVTIGSSVTSIGSYAFEACAGLTSVTIPDSVTSIGSYAFYFCMNLTSVVFEDTEGWQVSRYSDFHNYTSLSSAKLANASTAATYLKSTYYYYYYYWRKV